MKPLHINIENESVNNRYYRRVIYTSEHLQVVLMFIPSGTEIGMEAHSSNDQFFRVEEGEGYAVINNVEYALSPGVALVIPSGSYHNIISIVDLHLYTIYSPPHHPQGRVDLYRPIDG